MVGEIGGSAEEDAAEFIGANMSKPVVAYIAGVTAPREEEWSCRGDHLGRQRHRRCKVCRVGSGQGANVALPRGAWVGYARKLGIGSG